MSKIRKLSEEVINKIAAGEVIERPAYAVKELIENSIDAGASQIITDLKDNGLTQIKIIDNGKGIPKDELKLAVKSHTTSKIESENDLEKISWLGFRGEALASMKAVSNFEIKSRTNESKNGYMLKTDKLTSVGMPEGTQVIVKNIFSNTPARKKYLKSNLTEYRHIVSQIQSFALAYPDVSFELINNDKNVFKYKSKNRTKEIFGEELNNFLLKLNFKDSYLKIKGFISHPQVNFKTKNKMFIFVNKRRVQNTSLINAVKAGYKNLLMNFNYPFVCLFIEIQEDLVDVNVHPRKEIVKFIDETAILNSLKDSVEETLNKNNLTFSNLSFKQKLTKSELAKSLRDEISETSEGKIGQVKKSSNVIQIHNSYLITETKNGILLLDQHAVHEAILFYKYKMAYKSKKNENLKLKIKKPILVKLDLIKTNLLLENIDYLKKIGFEIEEFGKQTYKLSAVPLIATDLDPKKNLIETLEELENENIKDIEENINSMLAYLSCRSAIKSGDKLTKKQIKNLIKYLDKIDMGYTCPHGRPVKIELSKKYLDKMFRRI